MFCTHLNWRFDQSTIRQEQVRAICAFVAAISGPLLPADPVRRLQRRARQRRDAHAHRPGGGARAEAGVPRRLGGRAAGTTGAGITWSNDNPYAMLDLEPSRRIDYVFAGWPKAGGRGHVLGCEVVGTEPVDGIVPSDHYGVLATLRI